jgi:hypothetical protein
MACCKGFTIETGSGGCIAGANGTDPTPTTLLVVADIIISSITVPSTNGAQVAQIPWFSGVPVGNYKIEYVAGFIPWQSTSVLCLPVTNDIVGDSTGKVVGGFIAAWGMQFQRITAPFTIVSANFTGLECGVCGLVDTCNTGTLQTNTAALNPVAIFQVDSATFGRNGGDVASCPLVGYDTLGGATFRGSGSVTWRIIQTQHVYEQPVCIRIKDYAAVAAELGVCSGSASGVDYCATFPARCPNPTSEWTGTFPFRKVFFPTAADRQVQFFAIDIDLITFTNQFYTINGQAMSTYDNTTSVIAYRVVAGVPFWQLLISGYNDPIDGSTKRFWAGRKTVGTDPIGEYAYDASELPCATGPATICIETCP